MKVNLLILMWQVLEFCQNRVNLETWQIRLSRTGLSGHCVKQITSGNRPCSPESNWHLSSHRKINTKTEGNARHVSEWNVDIVRKKVFKNKPSKSVENKAVTSQICGKCEYKHEPRKCPAFGKIGKICNKRNHFAKKCKSKKMHEVQDRDNDSDIFLNSIKTEKQVNDRKVYVKILKNNVSVKLETGAQCNVLPLHVYKQISKKPLQRSKSRPVSYSGQRLDTVGKVTLLISSKDKYVPVEFEIVKNKATPIFGLKLV